jgi:hypothetical protein
MHYKFGTDCRCDFDGRSDGARREEASCEERREENPHRTQIKGEFLMRKRTLTMTKSSINEAALVEGDERIRSETAAILASASPLGITAMGAFPLSLIALGQITRRHFDDTLTLRPKRTTNATEALESPPQIAIITHTEQIETVKPGARPYPSPTVAQGRDRLAALATLIALVALFLIAMLPR